MEKVILTDAAFDETVLKATKPVLVDFWATWCGPCRVQSPIIDELARTVGDQYVVASMEVDQNPMAAQRYNILSIPTLMIFKNGNIAWQGSGIHQQDEILEELKKVG